MVAMVNLEQFKAERDQELGWFDILICAKAVAGDLCDGRNQSGLAADFF
jgi:hypothetical protein